MRVIAGFDCEKNHKASDGNIKDNGYGICLIPKKSLGNCMWDTDDNSNFVNKGYYDSTINQNILPIVANNLKNILSNHLIERNVLLSNSRDSSYHADNYIWTTAYCTLMSAGQITGTFASNANKYDDGEANYKLPLFNYETWNFDTQAWLRGIYGLDTSSDNHYNCTYGIVSGRIFYMDWFIDYGIRPLIYIR